MRHVLLVLPLLLGQLPSAQAQVSVGIGLSMPGVNIGINMPSYPQLVQVPGYPVYYAPRANSNYFFYDGLYWVFQNDDWYSSGWYNGPWQLVEPDYVPVYMLRVPVRYYRQPPVYFRGWRPDGPPQWGRHWGPDWEDQRRGWDRWDRRAVPQPAPLPVYQRNYSGERYPRAVEQQRAVRNENYRYQPREAITRHYDQPRDQAHDQQQRVPVRAEVRPPSPAPVQQQRPPPPPPPPQPMPQVQRSQPDQPRQHTQPVPAAQPQPQPQRETQGQGHGQGRGREAKDHEQENKGESQGRGRDKKND